MRESLGNSATAVAAPFAPVDGTSNQPQQKPIGDVVSAQSQLQLQDHEKTTQPLNDDDDEQDEEDQAQSERQTGELEDLSYSSDDDQQDSVNASLDKAMMNELLLVCSNLGMLRTDTDDGEPVFMRGEDCEEWIHDLQRAIRRDHARHKLIAKQLGKWKILQKKLLPLLVNHQHDWSLVFSVMKVLVMLTMRPPRDSTNIAQQLKYLREYKHAFLCLGIIPILMSIIVEPLSKKGSARTSEDYLNMELVLTLIRNLLAIPDEDKRVVTSATEYLCHLQEQLICTLQRENVYELLVLFSQDIDSAENREWNLLIMEMVDLTLQCTTPKALVSTLKRSLPADNTIVNVPDKRESLVHKISGEKTMQHRATTRRHSNFGGMVKFVGQAGRSLVLTDLSKTGDSRIPQAKRKPQLRKRNTRNRPQINDINEVFGTKSNAIECNFECSRVLIDICDSILSRSYFQLTNSLKGEFRRGSSKLVSTDRLQYFHIVWFLTSYHRLKSQLLRTSYKQARKLYDKQSSPSGPPPEKPKVNEKAILSTLDMFSFNFVLQSIESYATSKNYLAMATSLQLLTEMMAYLEDLSKSDDLRMQRIAESLHHKIFYERDFLDRLPVLIKSWAPGLFSLEYAVDVVTLTHLVFKVLDKQGQIKVLSKRKSLPNNRKSKDGKKGEEDDSSGDDEEEEERQAQLQLEMQRKELDFDVRRYFLSILSHETIKMYCYLLQNYRTNHVKVNHYIHSFFYRVQNFKPDRFDDNSTMEPMLFNIHVLLVFTKLLNDASIGSKPEFADLLAFVRSVVRDFFELAGKNHLLFVEILFRHPFAAKACALMQNKYESMDLLSRSAKEAREQAIALGREQRIASINEARRQKAQLDSTELEGETEFDFVLQSNDFANSSMVANTVRAKDDHQEDENENDQERTSGPDLLQRDRVRNQRKSRGATERAKNWSKVEDRYLAKMFQRYRHLPSVYEVLSYEDMFQDRDRTAEQIERRVKYLKLHRQSANDDGNDDGDDNNHHKSSSDEEDNVTERLRNADAAEEGGESNRSRRRLRRLTSHVSYALSSSEDEDDVLMGPSTVVIDEEPTQTIEIHGHEMTQQIDAEDPSDEEEVEFPVQSTKSLLGQDPSDDEEMDQTQPIDVSTKDLLDEVELQPPVPKKQAQVMVQPLDASDDDEVEFQPPTQSLEEFGTQPTQATDATELTQTLDSASETLNENCDVMMDATMDQTMQEIATTQELPLNSQQQEETTPSAAKETEHLDDNDLVRVVSQESRTKRLRDADEPLEAVDSSDVHETEAEPETERAKKPKPSLA